MLSRRQVLQALGLTAAAQNGLTTASQAMMSQPPVEIVTRRVSEIRRATSREWA